MLVNEYKKASAASSMLIYTILTVCQFFVFFLVKTFRWAGVYDIYANNNNSRKTKCLMNKLNKTRNYIFHFLGHRNKKGRYMSKELINIIWCYLFHLLVSFFYYYFFQKYQVRSSYIRCRFNILILLQKIAIRIQRFYR